MTKEDKILFDGLNASLNKYCYIDNVVVTHEPFPKSSGSLYRFGWFYINGYKYSISGWKFKDGLVTFEREDTGEKIKYSIPDNNLKVGRFQKDNFIQKIVKQIRNRLSLFLKDLSDKLQP